MLPRQRESNREICSLCITSSKGIFRTERENKADVTPCQPTGGIFRFDQEEVTPRFGAAAAAAAGKQDESISVKLAPRASVLQSIRSLGD